MAKSASDEIRGISSDAVTSVLDCSAYKIKAASLMQSPTKPRVSNLRKSGLVFAPFPEQQVLDYADRIYLNWLESFRSGVVTLEDYLDGEDDEADPLLRFGCGRIEFRDASSLRNGLFHGAYLMWLEYPWACLTVCRSEASGLLCPSDRVEAILGKSLLSLVEEFGLYSEKLDSREGRSFFQELARLYSSQV